MEQVLWEGGVGFQASMNKSLFLGERKKNLFLVSGVFVNLGFLLERGLTFSDRSENKRRRRGWGGGVGTYPLCWVY